MINLKKNDKLIIIIAIAVVVVAAIGIAAYNSPEGTVITNGNVGVQTYDVTWKTSTKTVTVEDDLYAGKNEPFNTEITIDHENILKVTVEISWTDDYIHGILFKRGYDTLTAEVSYSPELWESVGNGTTEFINTIRSLPYDTPIEADNELEALEKLKEDYYNDDSITFTIDVSVQTGEKWFRPLKYLRDKGNAFDLTITYEYFEPSLTEGEDKNTGGDDPDDPPSGDDAFSRLGNLVNTGSGVRW